MNTILLFGAGKSTGYLIDYLGKLCNENNWNFFVCDSNLQPAKSKTKNFQSAHAVSFDVSHEEKRREFISKSDVVISMLPPALHFLVAKDCMAFSKHLLTASYVDEKIRSLKTEIEKKGLLFLSEMGLDPGLDHMSAMRIINSIKKQGGKIISFKSYCGGLVSPESDNNPWHYKITWNPANVVTAGNAGAVYKEGGKIIHLPYAEIFKNENNLINVPGLASLAWYANRDSLSYIDTYQLYNATTFIRATLRYPSFCRGWQKIIQLDLTNKNDHDEIKDCTTFEDWFTLKKEKLTPKFLKEIFTPEFTEQINFLMNSKEIPFPVSNSAVLLQYLLEKNLAMNHDDKDMIVMLHEIEYSINKKHKSVTSRLVINGEDQQHTAMARTVGLPLAIATRLILENKINLAGLHIPVLSQIYEPVLEELELNGIKFIEETKEI
jgi:saccharopine dehydrogenase (NADP+, L-glutamate forming)